MNDKLSGFGRWLFDNWLLLVIVIIVVFLLGCVFYGVWYHDYKEEKDPLDPVERGLRHLGICIIMHGVLTMRR